MEFGTTIQNLPPDSTPNFQFPMVVLRRVERRGGPDRIPLPAIRRPYPQPPDASRRPQELMWSTPHKSYETKTKTKTKIETPYVGNIHDFEVHTFELARFDILPNPKTVNLSRLVYLANMRDGCWALPSLLADLASMIFTGYIPCSIYTLVC